MKNTLAITFVVGLGAVALVVAAIFYMQRGAQINLPGKVVQIHTVPIDEGHSVAVADFEVRNSSDYPFMVRSVTLILEDADGTRHPGLTISQVDTDRFFEATPSLGTKFGKTMITRSTVPARTTENHIVMSNFDVVETRLQQRKQFIVRIEEIDGKVFELPEK